MAILKKVPAFLTPDGFLFEDELHAAQHMFKHFITEQLINNDAGTLTHLQLDALWDCRFELTRVILQLSTTVEDPK